jgi:hypothetical protein
VLARTRADLPRRIGDADTDAEDAIGARHFGLHGFGVGRER